ALRALAHRGRALVKDSRTALMACETHDRGRSFSLERMPIHDPKGKQIHRRRHGLQRRGANPGAAVPRAGKWRRAARRHHLRPGGRPGAKQGVASGEALGGIGDLEDGTYFRRIRLQTDGKFWENYDYTLTLALENNQFSTVGLDEFWVGATNIPFIGTARLGHVKNAIGIEADMSGSSKV